MRRLRIPLAALALTVGAFTLAGDRPLAAAPAPCTDLACSPITPPGPRPVPPAPTCSDLACFVRLSVGS